MTIRSIIYYGLTKQAVLRSCVSSASRQRVTPVLLPRSPHLQARRMSSPPTSSSPRYKLVFFVPLSHLEDCKEAVFATGAGSYPQGKYSKACFQSLGTGQFLPGDSANPNIGQVGEVEKVEEMRVEILCLGRETVLQAVERLLKTHPYEEPAYEVYKLEDI